MADINDNPQNYPASGAYTQWQILQDYGQGLGAIIAGQPFQIFRCSASGDYVQTANKLYDTYATCYEKARSDDLRGLVTDTRQGTFWFAIRTDMTPLLVGDIFILNDPWYGQGANYVEFPTNQFVGFCFAGHGVLKTPIGARLDRQVKIYRAANEPDGLYFESTIHNARPLVCTSGTWALAANGATPSYVPAGFQPDNKGKGLAYNDIGDQPRASAMKIYIPPLKGFLFKENDIIEAQNGDRYRVINPFFQNSDIVGNQLVCDRVVSQV